MNLRVSPFVALRHDVRGRARPHVHVRMLALVVGGQRLLVEVGHAGVHRQRRSDVHEWRAFFALSLALPPDIVDLKMRVSRTLRVGNPRVRFVHGSLQKLLVEVFLSGKEIRKGEKRVPVGMSKCACGVSIRAAEMVRLVC